MCVLAIMQVRLSSLELRWVHQLLCRCVSRNTPILFVCSSCTGLLHAWFCRAEDMVAALSTNGRTRHSASWIHQHRTERTGGDCCR